MYNLNPNLDYGPNKQAIFDLIDEFQYYSWFNPIYGVNIDYITNKIQDHLAALRVLNSDIPNLKVKVVRTWEKAYEVFQYDIALYDRVYTDTLILNAWTHPRFTAITESGRIAYNKVHRLASKSTNAVSNTLFSKRRNLIKNPIRRPDWLPGDDFTADLTNDAIHKAAQISASTIEWLAADAKTPNPWKPLLDLYKHGYYPVGVAGDKFVVLCEEPIVNTDWIK